MCWDATPGKYTVNNFALGLNNAENFLEMHFAKISAFQF